MILAHLDSHCFEARVSREFGEPSQKKYLKKDIDQHSCSLVIFGV